MAKSGSGYIDLKLGTVGSRVALLKNYLRRFGYLAEEEKNQKFELIDTEANTRRKDHDPPSNSSLIRSRIVKKQGQAANDYFDAATEKALREYQRYFHIEITGILDLATERMMQRPRCGVPDLFGDTFRIGDNRDAPWPGGKRDFSYYIANGPPGSQMDRVRAVFRRAVEIWASALNGTFRLVGAAEAADIRIEFLSQHSDKMEPFDGSGRVRAHSQFPPERLPGFVLCHFNNIVKWHIEPSGESVGRPIDGKIINDLVSIVAHEIGHALGLRQHSFAPDALMYATGGIFTPHRFLSDDDKRRVRLIY